MSEKFWEVVGGENTGGILVRTGKEPSSQQADGRLSSGALVRQIELVGDRLHYERVTGTGPDSGWVATKVKGNDLVVLVSAAKAAKKQAMWVANESEKKDRMAKINTKREAAGLEEKNANEQPASSMAQKVDNTVPPPVKVHKGPIPPIPRDHRFPEPKTMGGHAKLFRERTTDNIKLHFYIFYGSADYCSTWFQFVNTMPDSIDVAVYERAGQGSRKDEPVPESVEATARDAVEAMVPALRSYARGGTIEGARFALLGHSTGGPIMCEVARLARMEFGVEPCGLVSFDEAPPNHPHLSDFGFKLLCENPDEWLKIWNPDIKDPEYYVHDNRIYNVYRRACPKYGGKFHCDICTIAAENCQKPNDTYQAAKANGTLANISPEWAQNLENRKRRAKLYASSEADQIVDFTRDSYEKWVEWTTADAELHWFEVEHTDMKFHEELTLQVQKFLLRHLE